MGAVLAGLSTCSHGTSWNLGILKLRQDYQQQTEKMATWGYKKKNGPGLWRKDFPVADGPRQSPINIDAATAVPEAFPAIDVKYGDGSALSVTNTGASWLVKLPAEGSSLTGGAIPGQFKVWQMHAHWGSCAGHGSEHTVNGKQYDAELHIVHYNTKYGTPENAADKPDGLAVLGIFIEEGKEHPEFAKMMPALTKALRKGQTVKIDATIDPAKFLPENRTFYNYEGSLTTPPLLESVIWTVFKEHITMSEEQVKAMRCMKSPVKTRTPTLTAETWWTTTGLLALLAAVLSESPAKKRSYSTHKSKTRPHTSYL